MSEKRIFQLLIFRGLTHSAEATQPLLHADTAIGWPVRAGVVSEPVNVYATTGPWKVLRGAQADNLPFSYNRGSAQGQEKGWHLKGHSQDKSPKYCKARLCYWSLPQLLFDEKTTKTMLIWAALKKNYKNLRHAFADYPLFFSLLHLKK